ncbi:4-hydroxy-tetrahydrodipicolinate synthase [Maribrevibacterium harenarium]|uniref:4-hydroxy-tetrahydrodipicolinate synthase n=1 Tax=Maribrevibacterium harenarium TaxID=2589817 RepID=A0A501WR54_9GAMM|nr:4-hydroxy-tetrahydrodipicolinate synthase [Maribrevibacterium harenarium]TPE49471.1 4-hydroxy-tetrahydrodipicolinate synthase [Maribrevibacterium harenarium]
MKLKGILPALITPFDKDENIDFDALAKIIEKQLADGVHGFAVLGTSGEYYAMNHEERAQVLKFVKEQVNGRVPLIAGTNAPSTREVIELTKTAKEIGYDTVLLSAPFYALPSNEELIAHFHKVLDAVDVELVLYNYPIRSGVDVGLEIMEEFKDNERVIAIKESSGSLLRALDINARFSGKIDLSCGSDDQALDFFLWGATSWICGPANFLAPQVVRFYNAFEAGDILEAKRIIEGLFPVMACLEESKFIQKLKYGAELAGVPGGECRAPLLPLTDAEKADMRAAFAIAQAI